MTFQYLSSYLSEGFLTKFLHRYIHDEMYGVKLDTAGNYLLLGGSGDEYSYSSTDSVTGWQSDVWVSYLVVLDPQVSELL